MISTEYSFPAQQVRDFLLALGKDLNELEPLLKRLVEYYRTEVQPEIFAAHSVSRNGGLGHPPWKPLSPRYLASQQKRESKHPSDILRLSGDFARDLTTGTEYTLEEYRVSQGNAEAVFGSLRKYPIWAGAAQGGPRQAMYLTPQAVQRMDEMVNSFLSVKIREERIRRRKGGKPSVKSNG